MYIADSVRECAVKMSKPLITYSERTINIDKTIQSTHFYVRECAVKMSKPLITYSERTINIDKTIQFNPHALIKLLYIKNKC